LAGSGVGVNVEEAKSEKCTNYGGSFVGAPKAAQTKGELL
jgi:hypothetical protein